MTLNQIIKQLREIAQKHKQINTFGFGDLPEIGKTNSITYPLMWVNQQPSTMSDNDLKLRYKIFFCDLVHKDNSNSDEVLSDQLLNALDVVAQLQHPSYEWNYTQSANLEPFYGKWDDEVTGWILDCELDLPNTYNRCAIPFEPDAPLPIEKTGFVTIFDTDGNIIDYVSNDGSYTVQPSGGLTCETIGDCPTIQGIQQSIVDEVSNRESADITLQNNIDEETQRAQGAESDLQTNIDNEVSRAEGVEEDLQQQITDEVERAELAESDLQTAIDNIDLTPYQLTSEKGQANGYASLDAGGKVPTTQLPSTLLVYKGVWNATTNTPTLTNNDITKAGFVYNVGTAGTQFSINWSLGDWLIYNDAGVIEKSDNSDDVTSVNGYQGAVTLNATDVDALKRDGSNANSDVTIDGYSVYAQSFHAKGTAGAGHLGLKHQSVNATTTANETSIFAGSDGEMYYKNDGNTVAQFASRAWVAALGYLTSSAAALTYQVILTAQNFGTFLIGLTSKTTPIDADSIVISDSADSDKAKKVSLTNFYTYLKTKFDSVYQNALGYTSENTSNKSDSYTLSSSTTYSTTKALVDGLATKQNSLGYTAENSANKENTTLDTSTTKYPTNNLVKTNIDLKAPIASPTFTGTVTTPAIVVSSETASRIAIIDASKNIKSADTSTYPSLTELSYLKGLGGSIGNTATQNIILNILSGTSNLSTGTGQQNLFTLNPTLSSNKTFKFRIKVNINKSTTSTALSLAFTGTASVTNIRYVSTDFNLTSYGQTQTAQNSVPSNTTALTSIVNTATGSANMFIDITGEVRIGTGGTFIPQIKFGTDPGGTPYVDTNSYFELIELGTDTLTTIGTWS